MNPFKVLNINRHALNKEIIQAAAKGMREKKYSAKEIAQAQKMLIDPVSRACQEFLYFVDLTQPKERLGKQVIESSQSLEGLEISDSSQLKCLTVFDKNHDH